MTKPSVCPCFVYFRLLAQLDETENAFEQFWSKHHLKLEQCLQLRHFEQDFREVITHRISYSIYFEPTFMYFSVCLISCCSMFCVCVFVKVKLSLDSLMETLLTLSDTGDGAGRIEQLLNELRSLQDRAQVRLIAHPWCRQ